MNLQEQYIVKPLPAKTCDDISDAQHEPENIEGVARCIFAPRHAPLYEG